MTELPSQFNRALDNGVKASEVSEVITHLAFYSGWANAMSAVAVAKGVFRARRIGADQVPPASGPLLPIDKAAETQRATSVEQNVGSVAPGVVQYTSDPLFHDLWLRPALAPRDRSIVTLAALIARNQTFALAYYIGQALDYGVKPGEVSEVIVHLAYYSGWGNAYAAVSAAKEVFAGRGIGPDQLPPASGELLPVDENGEAQRASAVEKNFGSVAPGVVQ